MNKTFSELDDKKSQLLNIIKLICVFCYPMVLCLIYCACRGENFFRLYVPNSYNNDSLFYYKLVEGALGTGRMGFFGYNEKISLYGGFAAWNPALLIPWFVWGFLCGWGGISPFLCNIVLFSLALTLFVANAKSSLGQTAILLCALSMYSSLPIHLLSVLPEMVVVSALLLFFSMVLGYVDKQKLQYLIIAMCIGVYLTVCRPYYILLLIIPAVYLIKNKEKFRWLLIVSFGCASILFYFVTTYFLTAEYWGPLFDVSIIKAVFNGQFSTAYWRTRYYLGTVLKGIGNAILDAFRYGLTMGTQYAVFIAGVIFVTIGCLGKTREKANKKILHIGYIILSVALLGAIVFLLHAVNEGGRHCMALSLVGLILVYTMHKSKVMTVAKVIMAGMLLAFLCRGSSVPTDYDVPFQNEALYADVIQIEEAFTEKVTISGKEKSFDNTVIWLFSDLSQDGNSLITDYNELYALPAEMGINCCTPEYVDANFDNLKSGYIAVPVGGMFDERCAANGYEVICKTNDLIIYRTRHV